MPDWLIKFRKRQGSTLQFNKKTQIKSNIIKYISSDSILQCNLIEGPFIYKVTGALGDLGTIHLKSGRGGWTVWDLLCVK